MTIDITQIGLGVDTSKLKAGTKELDNFSSSADKAAGKADNLGGKTTGALSSIGSAAKAAGISLAGVGVAVLGLGAATLKTYIEFEKLNNTLKFATGSANAAAKEMDYIKRTVNGLGLELLSTAQAYTKFSAATKGTALEGQKTRDVFEAVAKASVVMGLSAEESSGALLAISQMMSKGTVSAEELRGQLGERLPGAFQIAAKSIGVTTQELGKMLEQGQIVASDFLPKFADELTKSLGDNPNSAAGSAQAQLNKLSNAWLELKKNIAESGVVTITIKGVEALTYVINSVNKLTSGGGESKQAQKDTLSSLLELQERGNAPEFMKAKNASEIVRLRRALGILQESQLQPATGISPDSGIAPNFNVTTKEGHGGFGTDINVIHKLEAERARAYKEQQDKRDAIRKANNAEILKDLQDQIDWEQSRKETQNQMELDAIKKLEKEKEDAYKKELERMDKIQKIANQNFENAQNEFKKAEEKKQREFEKTVDGINQVFREGFANMVNGGKGTWKSFTKSLITTFKTTVADQIYRMFAQPFVVKLVASIMGIGVSGAASAADNIFSSSGGSIFGSISDGLKSLNADVVGSIEKLGTFLSTGNGGLGDTIGGALSQYSSQIAGALTFAPAVFSLLKGDIKGAAFQGAGAGIGLALGGPVGGAIGAFLGGSLSGIFGGGHVSRPKYYANTSVSSLGASTLNAFGNSDARGTGGGAAITPGMDIGAALRVIASQLGGSIKNAFVIGTKYMQKYNSLEVKVGSGITKTNSDFLALLGNASQSGSIVANTFLIAVKRGLIDLPDYLEKIIKGSFAAVGVRASPAGADKVLEDVASIKALYDSLADMPPLFGHIKDAINQMTSTANLSKVQALTESTKNFYNLFSTDTEKFTNYSNLMHQTISKLNVAFPETREGFRSLVEGIDTHTAAGIGLYTSLVNLASPMDAYYKALEQQKTAVNDVAGALAELDINKFKTLVDYTRAQRYIENGNSTQGIPGFASGGAFAGGLRIVGENGPELESTGPSRIIGNSELMSNLRNPASNNAALIAEIGRLRQENQAQQIAIVQATQKMAKILDKFDNQGMVLSETNNSGTRVVLDTRTVL